MEANQKITAYPSLKTSVIQNIIQHKNDLAEATIGQSIIISLKDDIDLSRGDYLLADYDPRFSRKQFEAQICWMSESSLNLDQQYILQLGCSEVQVKITDIINIKDIPTSVHLY